ncbi:MAG: EAL domain-containing protein [Cyanobacteriota bacterium]
MTNILIVEDESIVAKDIEFSVKSFGYNVCAISHTGEDAIKKLYELKPDMVLLDIMLKGHITGIDVAEKIKDNFDIPIIFITAYKDKEIIDRANLLNPAGYIFKPFETKDLQINIELAIYKHNLEKKVRDNEDFLYQTMNSISDSIITTNIENRITFINKSAEYLFNIKKEDVLLKKIEDIIILYKNSSSDKELVDVTNTKIYRGNYLSLAQNKELLLNMSVSEIIDQKLSVFGYIYNFIDITDKEQSKKIIDSIVDNTTSSVGDEFFKSLVKSLANLLNVKFAFVCDYPNLKKNTVRVISAWEVDGFNVFKNYNMKNTPSEKIKDGNLIFYKDNIQELFPSDELLKRNNLKSYMAVPIFDSKKNVIGHMGVMNDSPMKENKIYKQILKFMSQRASAEIQRKRNEEEVLKSEKKYKVLAKKYGNLLDSLPQAVFETDNQGLITFANSFTFKVYGFSTKDFNKGIKFFNIIDDNYKEKMLDDFKKVISGEKIGLTEYLSKRKDGSTFNSVIHSTKIMDEKTKNIGTRVFVVDVTDLRKTEKALKDTQDKYNLTIKGSNDGFWDLNLITGKIQFSALWKKMIGYKDSEMTDVTDEWFSRVHDEDITNLKEMINKTINEDNDYFECEYRIKNVEGKYIWMLCKASVVRDKSGKIYRIGGSQTNIQKHKENQNELDKLLKTVSHDLLTGLPNRALFLEKIEKAIINIKKKKEALFSVLYIDIDRFKVINDNLGHNFGNIFLMEFSKRINSLLNEESTLARLGGDEFAILVENIQDKDESINLAQKIQKEFRNPFIINNKEVFSTVSIGLYSSFSGNEQSEEILRSSDIAMYRAKALGRARYEVFESSMKINTMEIFQIETDLRYAIEKNELVLYYQPIISLETGKITGFEALLRWFHKKKGLIPSSLFIPIAEDSGYIIKIGRWVFKEACNQIKIWNEKFNNNFTFTVNINISGRQFSHPNLVNHIFEIINQTEINPNQIRLEITESSIMDNTEKAKMMLHKLRELGLQLQIDDFGTGYSSLSYLHRFPVNTLKIDRSFVSRIDSSEENFEIIKTIISLAKNLNMKTTSEGIETEVQLRKLRELNCEYGQGFFFSKALPVEELERLIDSNPTW